MSGEEMKDPLRLDDRHKCVMCEARLGSKEELQEHFRLHANSQIDMKGRKAVNAVKPIVKQVIFKKMTLNISFKFDSFIVLGGEESSCGEEKD